VAVEISFSFFLCIFITSLVHLKFALVLRVLLVVVLIICMVTLTLIPFI